MCKCVSVRVTHVQMGTRTTVCVRVRACWGAGGMHTVHSAHIHVCRPCRSRFRVGDRDVRLGRSTHLAGRVWPVRRFLAVRNVPLRYTQERRGERGGRIHARCGVLKSQLCTALCNKQLQFQCGARVLALQRTQRTDTDRQHTTHS